MESTVEGFDDAVRRDGHRLHSGSEVSDCLMVQGIDTKLVFLQQAGQGAGQSYRMGRSVIGFSLPVDQTIRSLGREVLPEGAAERSIDELKAAADAEDGFVKREGFP